MRVSQSIGLRVPQKIDIAITINNAYASDIFVLRIDYKRQ